MVVVAHIVFVGNVQLVVPRFHCFRVQFRPQELYVAVYLLHGFVLLAVFECEEGKHIEQDGSLTQLFANCLEEVFNLFGLKIHQHTFYYYQHRLVVSLHLFYPLAVEHRHFQVAVLFGFRHEMCSYVDSFFEIEVEPLRNLRAAHTLVACVKTCTKLYYYCVRVFVEEVLCLVIYQIGTNATPYLREFDVFELCKIVVNIANYLLCHFVVEQSVGLLCFGCLCPKRNQHRFRYARKLFCFHCLVCFLVYYDKAKVERTQRFGNT